MCELLAMSANVPTDICFSFSGLILRSGVTGPHKDGWGITFYEGKGARTFKDTAPGIQSQVAELVENYPIKSCLVMSHIRKANRGRVCLENTHPFERELWGRWWSFAHNGQLKGIKKRSLQYYHPVGSTDSEYAFCWVLDQLVIKFHQRPANDRKLWTFLDQKLKDLNQLGVFNMLMADGQYLYTFCSKKLYWITRRAPFGEAKLVDKEVTIDFKKVTTDNDIVTIIATQPLTDNENWNKMSKDALTIFSSGRICYADESLRLANQKEQVSC